MEDKEKQESNAVGDDRSTIEESGHSGDNSDDLEDTSVRIEFTDNEAVADEAPDDESAPGPVEEKTDEAVETESERFIRLAAEFDNYKKRTAREFESIIRRANERLLRELVEIVDNFERALNVEAADDESQAYRKGVELIYNQLSSLLSKEGISAIESVGKPFDPAYHEAVMQVASDEYDEGVVAQEIQKGYKIDGKVLRHARVIVSRGPGGEDQQEGSSNDE